MPTTSAGCRRFESGVKSTTSANRIDAEANWSAIVPVSALSLSAIERGRMFRSRLSARSCSTRSAASGLLALAHELGEEPEHDGAGEGDVERDHRAARTRPERSAPLPVT